MTEQNEKPGQNRIVNSKGAPRGNGNAVTHGASGIERRIEKRLPLAEDDKRLRDEIIISLGYDPAALPRGPMGHVVDLVADNVLLAQRFRSARHWAAEQGNIERFTALAQRSGWRNDKAIGQLLELVKLQQGDDTNVIEAIRDAKDSRGA